MGFHTSRSLRGLLAILAGPCAIDAHAQHVSMETATANASVAAALAV